MALAPRSSARHAPVGRAATLALLTLSLLATAALALAGCGGGSSGSGTPGQSAGGSSGAQEIASAADLAAALKRDHGDADWYADVTDVADTTVLGAPAMVIRTPWKLVGETDPAVFDAVNAKEQALSEALGAYDYANTVNLIVLRVDGTLQHAGGEGVDARPFAEAFDLPPAPTKPAELKQWLEKVYGPGGIVKLGPDEDWYGSIKSVKPGESVSAAAIVETSLPTATDPRFSMVQLAVSSSSTPMLQQGIWISALDGTGASMGGGGGSPLLYPAP
ncbi:MAG: hypothetical protein QMD96_03830 [Anaerosomatales bacterium]|nr:hypothetical protein [Anaerosomatales bacterium]